MTKLFEVDPLELKEFCQELTEDDLRNLSSALLFEEFDRLLALGPSLTDLDELLKQHDICPLCGAVTVDHK